MLKSQSDMADHVTFCPQSNRIMDRGSEAEWRTAAYLYDNLIDKEWKVGNYRILVNYNLPVHGKSVREIDLVMINKFGVFLLEVKSWLGNLDAYDDDWILQDTIKRENPVESINSKARIFHSQMFGPQGRLRNMLDVSVTGLVVLTQGLRHFHNYSSTQNVIVGLDQQLLHAVGSTDLLFKGRRSRTLSDENIEEIYHAIFGRHQSNRDELIENYRIERKLRDGDLFEEYEAQNINVDNQRVRIKRYKLQRLSAPQELLDHTVRQFKRSVEVVSALGSHPHIVNTINFFPDAKRPDIYYEITELVDGQRLDEIMLRAQGMQKALSLQEQLDYLEPLCEALQHAHNHSEKGNKRAIYHRNISPETVFMTQGKVIKLADFDFAKYSGSQHSLVIPGQPLIDKPFTAPELFKHPSNVRATSDIYSLGVLWYFLACLPTYDPNASFNPRQAEAKIDALKLPPEARALMKIMVDELPANRPQTIEEVAGTLKQLHQQKRQAT